LGRITALSWVLEVGEVKRFRSVKQVISYCGLCADEISSAGVAKRGPLAARPAHHGRIDVLHTNHDTKARPRLGRAESILNPIEPSGDCFHFLSAAASPEYRGVMRTHR